MLTERVLPTNLKDHGVSGPRAVTGRGLDPRLWGPGEGVTGGVSLEWYEEDIEPPTGDVARQAAAIGVAELSEQVAAAVCAG